MASFPNKIKINIYKRAHNKYSISFLAGEQLVHQLVMFGLMWISMATFFYAENWENIRHFNEHLVMCSLIYIFDTIITTWLVCCRKGGGECVLSWFFFFFKTKSHKEYVVVQLSWHSWCRWHFVKLKTLECGNCKRVQTEGFFVSILRIPTCFFVGKVQRAHIFSQLFIIIVTWLWLVKKKIVNLCISDDLLTIVGSN